LRIELPVARPWSPKEELTVELCARVLLCTSVVSLVTLT